MPFNKKLKEIVGKLTKRIPDPEKVGPRPSSSWRKLKPGQLLQLREQQKLYTPELNSLRAGALLVVDEVNSQGAKLRPSHPWAEPKTHFGHVWWRNPEWEAVFLRIRKTKKPEASAASVEFGEDK